MEEDTLRSLLKEGVGSGAAERIPESWWMQIWGGKREGGRRVFVRPAAIADLKMGSKLAARKGELAVAIFQWAIERFVEGLRVRDFLVKPWEVIGLDVGTSGWRAYCVAGDKSVEIVRVLRCSSSEERIEE
jgi:hypothetical protein